MPRPKSIYGTSANDLIFGSAAAENIYGGAGDDEIDGGGGADLIQGGDGDDRLFGGDGDDRVYGDGGTNYVDGGAGNDIVGGGDGNDTVFGGAGDDRVIGHLGDDTLSGGDGNDVLIGEWGADVLWGGQGADLFQYGWGADSSTRTDWYAPDPLMTYGADFIADFESGIDVIDLSRIDANLTTPITQVTGKGGKTFAGSDAFEIVHTPSEGGPEPSAGQLTLSYDAEANVTTLNGYMDDAAGADFTLLVSGTVAPGDLIL